MGIDLGIGIDNRGTVNICGFKLGSLDHFQTGAGGKNLTKSLYTIFPNRNYSSYRNGVSNSNFGWDRFLRGLQFDIIIIIIVIIIIKIVKFVRARSRTPGWGFSRAESGSRSLGSSSSFSLASRAEPTSRGGRFKT